MFTYGCTCLHNKRFFIKHPHSYIAKYGYNAVLHHYEYKSSCNTLLCCSLRKSIVSVLIKMLNMFNRHMVESTVCHVNEQIVNSEECSELGDTTSAAMMFSDGCVVIMMDTSSSMIDKKYSIYCYFSSTFEVVKCL